MRLSRFPLLLFSLAIGLPGTSAQIPGRAVLPYEFSPSVRETPALPIPMAETNYFVAFTLRCTGDSPGGAFAVRAAGADRNWNTSWLPLEDDGHVALQTGIRQFEMVFLPAETRFVQVRRTDGAGALEAELIFFSPVDPTVADPAPAMVSTMERSACPCPLPVYVNRTGWGGPPNQQAGCTPSYTSVTHLIVHHQAGAANPPYSAVVYAIWQQHVFTNGWCDIGYNWVIAPDGTVYEGRAGGNNVLGAHFCAQNANTMGVCFLGNFQNDQPTPAALSSLEHLLAWKCCDSNIDPTGTSLHAGSGLVLKHISGHRDGCSTLCPGDNLYAKLPEVRTGTNLLYSDPTGCDGIWPPGNDDCDNAFTLFSGTSCQPVAGTTDDATASGVPIPTCNGFTSTTALDVWYRFASVETHHQVTVTPKGNAPNAVDPVIAVYDGSCANPVLVDCADAPGGSGVPTVLDLPDLTPGHIYRIRVYDYGATAASDGRFDICVTHGPAVATWEAGQERMVQVFPNPSSGPVTIQMPSAAEALLRCFDAGGQLVLEQKTDTRVVRLDLAGQPQGVYVLEIRTADGVWRRRLVLQ